MNTIDDLERKLDQLLEEPDDAQLFNDIGVLLYLVKDQKNAELYFQKAYELNPINRDILYNYASLLHLQCHWRKAVTIYQDYLKLYPDDREVAEKLGDCYYQLGGYDQAAKVYEQLSKMQKGEYIVL